MKITVRTVLITLSLALALAGCGAKGPLFMPEKTAPVEAPADEPADAEDAATDPANPAAGAAQSQPPAARRPATPGSDG
ncbi:MAG TPA: lipoprotein [Pseudoxanthomonas sp.]|nr:lipoprotein [Pseudoxanthomonas sp.]